MEAIIIMNRQIASKISKILFTCNFFIIHFLYSIYTYVFYTICILIKFKYYVHNKDTTLFVYIELSKNT